MCHPVLTNTNLFSGEDVSGELDDGVVSLADRLLQVVQTSDLGGARFNRHFNLGRKTGTSLGATSVHGDPSHLGPGLG